MNKYIITFGHGQLTQYPVDPLSVALVVEAKSVEEARQMIFLSPIGARFCTHYPYNEYIDKFKDVYGMVEWSLDDLLAIKKDNQ